MTKSKMKSAKPPMLNEASTKIINDAVKKKERLEGLKSVVLRTYAEHIERNFTVADHDVPEYHTKFNNSEITFGVTITKNIRQYNSNTVVYDSDGVNLKPEVIKYSMFIKLLYTNYIKCVSHVHPMMVSHDHDVYQKSGYETLKELVSDLHDISNERVFNHETRKFVTKDYQELKRLERELIPYDYQCVICYDYVNEKPTTRCNHHICYKCIETLHKKSKNELDSDDEERAPPCPVCRKCLCCGEANSDDRGCSMA